uniref:Uncharacterized protein n=1 Tax=Oryza brachyantha TaxID=4533 RepID=J3LRS6_ORYBR
MGWWEKGLQPNMREIESAQELAESLLNAGDTSTSSPPAVVTVAPYIPSFQEQQTFLCFFFPFDCSTSREEPGGVVPASELREAQVNVLQPPWSMSSHSSGST